MNILVIPFKLGYGKNGNALPSSGNYHALITETLSYPHTFNNLEKFKYNQFQDQKLNDWEKFKKMFDKYFLIDFLPKEKSDIIESSFPNNDKLVFVNIQNLKNKYKGLLSFKIEELNIEVKLN